jgi:type I restriction enzyme M protein
MAESGFNEMRVNDLRANAPKSGKRTPLTRGHFADFETAFGEDCNGVSRRTDQGETGRFSREDIKARGDSLDIAWLKDDSAEDAADLPEPAVLAREVMEELNGALAELEAILAELGETTE